MLQKVDLLYLTDAGLSTVVPYTQGTKLCMFAGKRTWQVIKTCPMWISSIAHREHSYGGHIFQSAAQGMLQGVKVHPPSYIRGNSQNDLINLKCMSICSLGHKEQKVKYMKCSSWSNFNENGLKTIGLSCRFRKCIVSYTLMSRFWSKERSKFNDHRPSRAYIGIYGH